MLDWLKSLLNPKMILKRTIDSLDFLVPYLADEIEKMKEKFAMWNSREKAQWCVDFVQGWLRKRFGIAE